MTITVPRTEVVEEPVEREVVTSVPRMQEVPVMETYEHEFTRMVPSGEIRGALRYSECAVMEAAWLRHQLTTLTARVAALEAALAAKDAEPQVTRFVVPVADG
jgi:hypothetical protein